MKKFPGLKIVADLYRLLALLALLFTLVAATQAYSLWDGVVMLITGGIGALVLYAVGEGIILFLSIHESVTVSAWYQKQLYEQAKSKSVIKPLKHARKSG